MRYVAMGRFLRVVRIRRGWRQCDVAAKAGLSASVVGRQEQGSIGSLGALERHAGALDLLVDLRLTGRAGSLIRLADEEHAVIVDAMTTRLRGLGHEVVPEASFSEWGERGRIDLLAFDRRAACAVIVEVKTVLLDLQDLLGALDVKERLVPAVARGRGWSVRRRATVLIVADTAYNRTVVRSHAALFSTFRTRRLGADAFIGPGRTLVWFAPARAGRAAWIGGRQRIRRPRNEVA